MEAWGGRVAVVSGAEGEAGRLVTEALLQAGLIVVGVAADAEQLKALSASGGQRFYARRAHPEEEEEVSAALKWAHQRLGGPHLLVQAAAAHPDSAGGGRKLLADAPVSAWRSALDAGVVVRAVLAKEFAALVAAEREIEAPFILLHVHGCAGEGVETAACAADKALCAALREEIRRHRLHMKVVTLRLGTPLEEVEEAVEAVDVESALCLILTAPAAAEVLDVVVSP